MQEFVFNFKAFAFGLAIGLTYMYMTDAPKKTMLSYPTPYNAGQITYKDEGGNCYQFVATKVPCPSDKASVKQQPSPSLVQQ